jgi:hypothetical protein
MSSKKIRQRRAIKAACGEPAIIQCGKEDGGQPTFSMLAYTGRAMFVGGWTLPVVIDLAGMNLGNKNRPILRDHDAKQIVGHSMDTVKSEASLRVDGVISGAGPAAQEVAESGRNGFPWQASVGVEVHKVVEVADGKTVRVNGMDFEGPLYVARKSKLYEVSFVALGADENTRANVAAEAVFEVEFEKGIGMDEEEKKAEAEKLAAEKAADSKKAESEKVVAIDPVKLVRAEQKRIADINAACVDYPEIASKAIEDGLTVAEAKAAMFDAASARTGSEISASYVNVGAGVASGAKVLEAAAVMGFGAIRHGKLEDSYDEKVLEAAHKYRNLGLRRMIEIACAFEGKSIEIGAQPAHVMATAFSTVSLPQMLSNVASKALLDEYNARESIAVLLAEKLTASDFKECTGVKLGGLGRMDTVQNGVAIKHGSMTEESFTYRVNTVGKLIGITREMLINDDLGGFVRMARNLGLSAFSTREFDFWKLVMDNASGFFANGNNNYITDALSIDGIAVAEAALMEQTGIDGEPIDVRGTWLVVPPQLGATARAIYVGTKVVGATSMVPDANAFSGVYEPKVTPYLSNSSVSDNYSETAWYLWSSGVKPYGIAYLNGIETPVVEEVDPGAEYLGRAWRAYFDYGVCEIDKRGAVLSTGAGS